jgi:hypothetical protein
MEAKSVVTNLQMVCKFVFRQLSHVQISAWFSSEFSLVVDVDGRLIARCHSARPSSLVHAVS